MGGNRKCKWPMCLGWEIQVGNWLATRLDKWAGAAGGSVCVAEEPAIVGKPLRLPELPSLKTGCLWSPFHMHGTSLNACKQR